MVFRSLSCVQRVHKQRRITSREAARIRIICASLRSPAGQAAVAGVSTIDVLGDSFQNHIYAPAVVRVPVGTTVTWVFNDRGVGGSGEAVPHNVIGAGWGSTVLAEGSFEQTFSAPGVYPYTCTLHSGMNGVVEVVAP